VIPDKGVDLNLYKKVGRADWPKTRTRHLKISYICSSSIANVFLMLTMCNKHSSLQA
jgi:hypothetical protein